MRIGYISRVLPSISETFVFREIAALKKLGVEIVPLSVHKPDSNQIQKETEQLFNEVHVINQPSNPAFWFAHPQYTFTRMKKYFSALSLSVLTPKLSIKDRVRAFSQFMLAPYAARTFKKLGLTHIHAHFGHIPTAIAMLGAMIAGISYSFTLHAYGLFADPLFLRQKLENASFVATVSHYNKNYLAEYYPGAAEHKTHVIRCGLTDQDFIPQPGKRVKPPLILGIGRLVPMKCFETLIEACALLRDHDQEFQCQIVGDGPERNHLQSLIHSFDLDNKVRLVGKKMQSEVKELFSQASIFALPSCIRESSDNLPVVLMESLAMKVPAISTNIIAIPEILQHGSTGLLVDPDSPEQLAEALQTIIDDPPLGQKLAEQGRKHVENEFNIQRSAEQLKELFKAAHKERTE